MPLWKQTWCFYNSAAFSLAASLALLGAIGIIFPALIRLPHKLEETNIEVGSPHMPYVNFNRARCRTLWLGSVTVPLSMVPPVLYGYILGVMDGQTCDVQVPEPNNICIWLIALYLTTVLVFILAGLFYWWRQDTLDKHRRCNESTGE